MEIDNEIISPKRLIMKFNLLLIQERQLSVIGQKYVHKNWLSRGLSLPRKRVSRLTDRLDMTLTVLPGS